MLLQRVPYYLGKGAVLARSRTRPHGVRSLAVIIRSGSSERWIRIGARSPRLFNEMDQAMLYSVNIVSSEQISTNHDEKVLFAAHCCP